MELLLEEKVAAGAINAGVISGSIPSFDTPVQCMQLSPTEGLLGLGSTSVSIVNLSRGVTTRTINEQDGEILGLDWHPLSDFVLASVGSDCAIRTWDIRSHPALTSTRKPKRVVRCVRFSPDSSMLACAGDGLSFYDLRMPDRVQQTTSTPMALDLCFSQSECVLATTSADRLVRFYDADSGECFAQSLPFDSPVPRIVFHPTESYLFAASSQRLSVLECDTYSVISQVPLPQTAASSPRPTTIAAAAVLDFKTHEQNIYHLSVDGDSVKLIGAPLTEILNCADESAWAEGTSVNNTAVPDLRFVSTRDAHSDGLPPPFSPSGPFDFSVPEPLSPQLEHASSGSIASEFELDMASSPASPLAARLDEPFVARKAATSIQRHNEPRSVPKRSSAAPKFNETFSAMSLSREPAPSADHRHAGRQRQSFTAAYRSVSTSSLASNDGKSDPPNARRVNSRAISGSRGGAESRKPPVPTGSDKSLPPRPTPAVNGSSRFTQSDKPSRLSSRRSSAADVATSSSRSDGSRPATPSDETSEVLDRAKGRSPVGNILKKRKSDLQNMITTARVSRRSDEVLEETTRMDEHHLFARLLKAYKKRPAGMSLKTCATMLPHFRGLLSDRNPDYVDLGLDMLNLVVDTFGESIRHGLSANSASPLGVDVTAEDRFKRCVKCRSALTELQMNAPFLRKRMSKPQLIRFRALSPAIESIVDE